MKSHRNLYSRMISFENLILAWRKARKRKAKKFYVIEFERELFYNLMALHYELKFESYEPKPLETFILRDPKTRKISKSDFRDRIVHHAVVNVLEPIFERVFIYDSYANRKNKGNLKAVERFYYFMRKVSKNGKINGWFNGNQVKGYCLKADIKHYFQEINHEILLRIIGKKVRDNKTLWLVERINANSEMKRERESNI